MKMQCDVERLEKHHHYDNLVQYGNFISDQQYAGLKAPYLSGGSHLGSPALDELCDFGDMQPAQVEVM